MYGFEKLKQNYEFNRAYRRGECEVTPGFVLYAVKGRNGRVRLGITAGKKLGCAVKRNRAKRVITAAFAENYPSVVCGYDYVIVARTRLLGMKSTDASRALRSALKRIGRIQ